MKNFRGNTAANDITQRILKEVRYIVIVIIIIISGSSNNSRIAARCISDTNDVSTDRKSFFSLKQILYLPLAHTVCIVFHQI